MFDKYALISRRPIKGLTRLLLCMAVIFSGFSALDGSVDARSMQALGSEIAISNGAADGAAVWGDLDNDGDQDLLVSGRGPGEAMTTLLLGNSDGAFSEAGSAGLPGVESSSLDLADFDRDGDLDVLITGQRGVTLTGELGLARVYQNDGSGSFTLFQNLNSDGVYRGAAEWGDVDNDGDLDILLTGYIYGGSGFGGLYRYADDAYTLDSTVIVPAVGDSAVAWGDYDADGDADFAVSGRLSEDSAARVAQVFNNDGAGGFSSIDMTANGLWYGSVAWLDADSDGDLDLIMTGNNGPDNYNRDPLTLLFLYDSADGFTQAASGLPDAWQTSLAPGDYDNDGDIDLLFNGLTSDGNLTLIYANTGGLFSDAGVELRSGTGASVAWGDLDNDGSLDVAVSGVQSDLSTRSTFIYPNLPETANTAPAAPAVAAACWVGGDTVVFTWSGAEDAQTPASLLTYNLRVGSASGLGDIISPPSAADGYQRAAQPGRYTSGARGYISGLSSGEYTWSVQAVDSAYTGSPFSAESSLAIGIEVGKYDEIWVGSADPVLIPVLDNDNKKYKDLVIQSVSGPEHGSAVIQDNQVLYTPDPDWAGIEEFDYYAFSPSTGHCSIASVSVRSVGLYMSPTWVKETQAVGSVVGGLTATPPKEKMGETFTYSLVSGEGSEDNPSFAIYLNKLITTEVFDAGVKDTYHVRVKAAGSKGTSLTRKFKINILDVALNPPTDILLSNTAIQENLNAGASVGSFSCIDPDENPCRFRLVDGEGGEDNALFSITGKSLRTEAAFDYEERSSYSIRVKAIDNTGQYLIETFTLSIINLSDSAPTAIDLSIANVAEDAPLDTLVGQFTSTDSDPSDTFRYRLVQGDGSAGNSAFRINGDQLITNQLFDYETQASYSIRVRSSDQTDRSIEQVFAISIDDVIETVPTEEVTPEPTVEPTVEPTAEPTAEPTVVPTSLPPEEIYEYFYFLPALTADD